MKELDGTVRYYDFQSDDSWERLPGKDRVLKTVGMLAVRVLDRDQKQVLLDGARTMWATDIPPDAEPDLVARAAPADRKVWATHLERRHRLHAEYSERSARQFREEADRQRGQGAEGAFEAGYLDTLADKLDREAVEGHALAGRFRELIEDQRSGDDADVDAAGQVGPSQPEMRGMDPDT
jgi:hypothetical protein